MQLEALHVVVDNAERDVAAEWGSWQTFPIVAATPPQQILPQNNKRKEAQIIIFGTAGYVLVGTRAQVQNKQGGQLQAGRYPFEAKQELWLAGDGTNAFTVTVLDERYQ
jgi:hypothetical protein